MKARLTPKKAAATAKKNKPASPKKATAPGKRTTAKSRMANRPGTIRLSGFSSIRVTKKTFEGIRRLGKEFGISIEPAASLAIAMGVMEGGLVLTPEEYEDSIKRVEDRWGVSIDRSKVRPFHPPVTDKQRQIAKEFHDEWVTAKRKESEAVRKKARRARAAKPSRPRPTK